MYVYAWTRAPPDCLRLICVYIYIYISIYLPQTIGRVPGIARARFVNHLICKSFKLVRWSLPTSRACVGTPASPLRPAISMLALACCVGAPASPCTKQSRHLVNYVSTKSTGQDKKQTPSTCFCVFCLFVFYIYILFVKHIFGCRNMCGHSFLAPFS